SRWSGSSSVGRPDRGKAFRDAAVTAPRTGRRATVPIATVNPATGETVKTYDEMSDADVDRCLDAAAAGHASYRLTSFDDRAAWLIRAAAILDDEQERVATMMTTEMGKTLVAARQEVAKCATACRYYAENGRAFLADERGDAAAVGAVNAYVSYQPLGPVLA